MNETDTTSNNIELKPEQYIACAAMLGMVSADALIGEHIRSVPVRFVRERAIELARALLNEQARLEKEKP